MDWPLPLVEDIARRRRVIFLGAGVSKNSVGDGNRRPPDWKEFLKKGAMRCRTGRQHIQGLIKQNNLLDACQLIRHHLDEEWLQLVREEFIEPRYRHTKLHEHIFELDLPIIVTTNVDKIYETAAQQLAQGNVVIKNYYDEDLSLIVKWTHRTRAIFRIHGTIDYPERMVFTREDYAKARARYATSYRILDALLLTHSFLFLGCSLTDPDILLLLEQYAVTQSALSPHYVVSAASCEAASEGTHQVKLQHENYRLQPCQQP
jgi:hypothetical protein